MDDPLPPILLAPSIRSRMIEGINGLTMHMLEAGFETSGRAGHWVQQERPDAVGQLLLQFLRDTAAHKAIRS